MHLQTFGLYVAFLSFFIVDTYFRGTLHICLEEEEE